MTDSAPRPARPAPLHELRATPAKWIAARPAGITALVLGVLAFVVVAATQPVLWDTPDWRISAPGFAATAVAALVSIARRERAHALWLCGVGIAATALVLGYFLMLAIVVGVVAVLMLILNTVM